MTGYRELGALLIVLGLLYAVSYVAWLYVARLRRSPAQAGTGLWVGPSVPDRRAQAGTGLWVGPSVQDSPAQAETRPQARASVQDWQTENRSQSQTEVAMPQDGTP